MFGLEINSKLDLDNVASHVFLDRRKLHPKQPPQTTLTCLKKGMNIIKKGNSSRTCGNHQLNL